jgi:ABC-type uncharacterized transport system substrate-binding protein
LPVKKGSAPIVAKVLRSSKPAKVRSQIAGEVGLVIKLKTAKRLGIVFSTAISLRTDEVIE